MRMAGLCGYLRMEITGMLSRRYGPFATRHKCLLFLDSALDAMGGAVVTDVEDIAQKRLTKRRSQYRQGWIIEDRLGAHYRQRKGGAA
jgi:hypothetical protein